MTDGIILSPEDAALLKMTPLEHVAMCLRNGNAPEMARVCEEAALREATMRAALKPFAKEADRWDPIVPDDQLLLCTYPGTDPDTDRGRE